VTTFPTSDSFGQAGGRGGNGNGTGDGGGGGAGGYGVVLTDTGAIGNLGLSAIGGAGGAGGTGAIGGNGGTGGIGLDYIGANASFTIEAAVSGGAGGAGGANGGLAGAGGAGIEGQNLTITMGATGTVAGGSGANAVTFTGGANSLTFTNSTSGLTGGIAVQSGSLDFAQATGSTTVANNISGGVLSKSGAGTIILSGISSVTSFAVNDGTLVNSGSLTTAVTNNAMFTNNNSVTGVVNNAATFNNNVNGTVSGLLTNTAAGVTFNNGQLNGGASITGGTLSGTGSVQNLAVNGGTFAPGNGTPGSSMNVTSSLAFQSAAIFMVQVNPTTASFANVTGTAALGGATVAANFAAGSYVSKQYTIVQATGAVSGMFNPTVANTNLPSNFHTSLSYDTRDAFLNLTLNFAVRGGGLNANQQNVGNALTNFFNSTGSIPLVFGSLTPAGLTQVSGETATGSQQTTFNAMNQFMGVMTDPFIARRGDPVSAGGSPNAYASEDDASAYTSDGRKRTDAARDAYAMFTKTPLANNYDPRWSVWAAGFGGSQSTDGNAAVGSSNTTSSIAGTAVGADYRFSPFTIAGFALAGGGTSFSVANGGSGRSDLFQAGAFVRHDAGAAYITGALAYGWQDIITNRTVTVAGTDKLRAEFNANAFSGRVESGYRFVAPWAGGIGITPYAAGQFTTFDLPAYAETALAGSGAFALSYAAKSVTDPRSELGFRTDKSFAMADGILTLRGRIAWAHDYDPNRAIAATFQSLPGASFVVNGAAQASDSALTTASIEKKWLNGWSAAATFEGEFSNVTNSYAGKGVVRYTW
jgi:uncharacterized protein with beta-barrel porin domain